MSNEKDTEMNQKQNGRKQNKIVLAILVVVLIVMCIGLGYFIWKHNDSKSANATPESQSEEKRTEPPVPSEETDGQETKPNAEFSKENIFQTTQDPILDQANRLAAMYDYEGAAGVLKEQPGFAENAVYTEAVQNYEQQKSLLKQWSDNTKIPHVFFHTLIVDTSLAFDGDSKTDDYNKVMTTVDEFKRIIQEMYNRGYVLVNLHDIAKMEPQPDGTTKMVQQPILLPEGKKPFVLSQDDVSYYEYMKGDGFASRLIIGENGKVTNEMEMADGSIVTGSYDVLPILEDFIELHPDFSYRGAKGILALTGYNGVFGYRTCDFWYNPNCDYFIPTEKNLQEKETTYKPNPNIEQDKETAKRVAEAIKAQGWELASHSWGHPSLQSCDMGRFKWDTDIWETEVEPILGETDIMIFPKGADIGTWRGYEADNERYQYLKAAGFNYFCNVDSSATWMQIHDDYFRQGRRNLDGTRMYEVVCGKRDLLSDLFDAKQVFDPARPTPVKGVLDKEEKSSAAQETETETVPAQ